MRNQAFRNIIVALSLALPLIDSQAQMASPSPGDPLTIAGRAPAAATAPTAVPFLVPYSGITLDTNGHPSPGETSATFLVYKDQQGGEPLFTETQTIAFDEAGRYKVDLGASNPNGLPSDLFSTGEARWLEVQVAGQQPEPRVLLASVPYALKAADAATLGGLPVSAFVLATNAAVANSAAQAIAPNATSTTVTTPGGTGDKLAKFSASNTIVNSIIYDNGTDIGIGTTTPWATLTVDGTFAADGNATVYGTLQINPAGTATTSKAYDSHAFILESSAYNSSSKAAVNPRFELQTEPTGNDSSAPSGTLNLLSSTTSTTPAETGLYFNTNGTIHFASGQTFPPSTSSSGTAVDGTSNSGTGVQGTSYTATGVAGSSSSGDGVLGYTSGSTLNTGGVVGQATGRSGFSGIAGIWGDSTTHTGVYGTSSQAQGVLGESTGGAGVQGASTNGVGVQGSSTNSVAGYFTNTSSANTVYALNAASNGGDAIYGVAQGSYGIAVYASETGTDGTGVEAFGNGNGVIGDTSGGVLQTAGVLGIAGSRTGVGGIAGVWGDAQEHVGVIGSSKDYSGVFASSTNSYGLQGVSSSEVGVYGVGASSNTTYFGNFNGYPVGVWGDTTGAPSYSVAVSGTASDGTAGVFTNNSKGDTVLILNYGSGDTISDVTSTPFRTLEASTPDGSCGFGSKGTLTCTGQLKSLTTTGGGSRTVETYSMQSPENWMEDFGSGTLANGFATITIEPAFAETVSNAADYHVFLTPAGDSKGLYVTRKTATSFEVHESGGGTSTIAFDYRIVAKRRGFETQRMADVTEAIKAVKAKNDLHAASFKRTTN